MYIPPRSIPNCCHLLSSISSSRRQVLGQATTGDTPSRQSELHRLGLGGTPPGRRGARAESEGERERGKQLRRVCDGDRPGVHAQYHVGATR